MCFALGTPSQPSPPEVVDKILQPPHVARTPGGDQHTSRLPTEVTLSHKGHTLPHRSHSATKVTLCHQLKSHSATEVTLSHQGQSAPPEVTNKSIMRPGVHATTSLPRFSSLIWLATPEPPNTATQFIPRGLAKRLISYRTVFFAHLSVVARCIADDGTSLCCKTEHLMYAAIPSPHSSLTSL